MANLEALLDPATTAVVTMEMQRGVVGDLATIPELAAAAKGVDLIAGVSKLVDAARDVGAQVCHATVSWRADRLGTPLNTPMAKALAHNPAQILHGSDAAELVPALDTDARDLRSRRHHGFTPFTGTDLDSLLRSCGITTIIASGVSVNVGVLGLCLTGTDLGYRVVLPTDAVIGMPARYAEEVIHHTLAPLCTLTTIDDVLAAWGQLT